MHEYRHLYPAVLLPALLFMACLSFTGCKVYTINKSDLESRLNPKHSKHGLSLNNLYKKQYRNNIDTLICADEIGQLKTRRFGRDSKIRIYTKDKSVKYYMKT